MSDDDILKVRLSGLSRIVVDGRDQERNVACNGRALLPYLQYAVFSGFPTVAC